MPPRVGDTWARPSLKGSNILERGDLVMRGGWQRTEMQSLKSWGEWSYYTLVGWQVSEFQTKQVLRKHGMFSEQKDDGE